MNNSNLIIYKLKSLYHILKELDQELNYKLIEISSEKKLYKEIKDLKNYLIITKKNLLHINNQFVINKLPIKIFKFFEKLNIEFLKQQFNNQSKIKINNYEINLNSREIFSDDIKLKLAEKEVNTIIYLSKIKKPVTINELQTNVWKYQLDIETHTVETHIYRLRKKILKTFKDNNFIINSKDGYQIK